MTTPQTPLNPDLLAAYAATGDTDPATELVELPLEQEPQVDTADAMLAAAQAAIADLDPLLRFTEKLPSQDPEAVIAAIEAARKAQSEPNGVRHEVVPFPLSTGSIPHYIKDEDGKIVQATYVIIVKRVDAGIYRSYQALLNTPGRAPMAKSALVQAGLVFPTFKVFSELVALRPDTLDRAHDEILKLTEQKASAQVAPYPAFLQRLGL